MIMMMSTTHAYMPASTKMHAFVLVLSVLLCECELSTGVFLTLYLESFLRHST